MAHRLWQRSYLCLFNSILIGALLLVGTACKESSSKTEETETVLTYPRLFVQQDQKELILSRIDREPYQTILQRIQARAEREACVPGDITWDYGAYGHNGEIAQANAFLAWLFDDEQAAHKAIELLDLLRDDWETVEQWDVNIRMASSMIGFTNAWDLLMATPWFEAESAQRAREKLLTIADKFYKRYVVDDFYRAMALGFSQNNHCIRTAASIGYVALAFSDDSRAVPMLNWAVSELDYLLGPDGQYIQPGGGVSEGPHYFAFALSPAMAALIALDNNFSSLDDLDLKKRDFIMSVLLCLTKRQSSTPSHRFNRRLSHLLPGVHIFRRLHNCLIELNRRATNN